MLGHIGEEVPFWRQLQSQVLSPLLLTLHLTFSLHTCTNAEIFLHFSGFHFKMPLITQYEPVQVTIQTDQVTLALNLWNMENYKLACFNGSISCVIKFQVRDIPCGTKGGVMITFGKIEVRWWGITLVLLGSLKFSIFIIYDWLECFLQVVNRLQKDHVYNTLLNYGVHYDNTWIYDKIHHEINQFCSSHSLQEVYIDVFDQASSNTQ